MKQYQELLPTKDDTIDNTTRATCNACGTIPPNQGHESLPHSPTLLPHSLKLLLTVEEAALQLSIGRTLMYDLVMRAQIASVKIGRVRRIPAAALQEFVAGQLGQTGLTSHREGGSR